MQLSGSFWMLLLAVFFRKDDWPDKRMAMDDRYGRSDFSRQERYQDFDHRDRGRYQDDMLMDRRDNTRGLGADRDGQVRGMVKHMNGSSLNLMQLHRNSVCVCVCERFNCLVSFLAAFLRQVRQTWQRWPRIVDWRLRQAHQPQVTITHTQSMHMSPQIHLCMGSPEFPKG